MIDKAWLAGIRKKNRAKFGMAPETGIPQGLGAGAQDIVGALRERRRLDEEEEAQAFERKQIESRIEIERQKIEAAKATGTFIPDMPEVMLPAVTPVPKSVLVVGGVVMVGLFGLIVFSVVKGKKKKS
jgi:hypothetical protein